MFRLERKVETMENKENSTGGKPPQKKGVVNSFIIGVLGGVSAIYLFNPGAGWIELINDNIPIIGNLDEAAAAALLISCLAYFGLDLGNFFGKAKQSESTEKTEDVIDV